MNIDDLTAQFNKQKDKLDELAVAVYKNKDKDTVFQNIDKRFENIVFSAY